MLKEAGRIVAVEVSGAWVETIRSSTCHRCAARAGCGHGVLARASGRDRGLIFAHSGERLSASQCAIDDQVEIELPESALLFASAMVYGAPLAAAIVSATLASRWGEGAAVGAFTAGMLLAFITLKWRRTGRDSVEAFAPRLSRRVVSTDSAVIAREIAP